MDMNGRCRNPTTGRVDHTKPGAEEAARRDRMTAKRPSGWTSGWTRCCMPTRTPSALRKPLHGLAVRGGGLEHGCAHHLNLPSEVGPRQHHRPGRGPDTGPQTTPTSVPQKAHTPLLTERQRKGRLRSHLQSRPKHPRPEPHGHVGTMMTSTQTQGNADTETDTQPVRPATH